MAYSAISEFMTPFLELFDKLDSAVRTVLSHLLKFSHVANQPIDSTRNSHLSGP